MFDECDGSTIIKLPVDKIVLKTNIIARKEKNKFRIWFKKTWTSVIGIGLEQLGTVD